MRGALRPQKKELNRRELREPSLPGLRRCAVRYHPSDRWATFGCPYRDKDPHGMLRFQFFFLWSLVLSCLVLIVFSFFSHRISRGNITSWSCPMKYSLLVASAVLMLGALVSFGRADDWPAFRGG